MTGVYLTIEDKNSLVLFLKGAARSGYLHKLDLREVNNWINDVQFPVCIPIDVNGIVDVGRNPIVKSIFGKVLDKGLTEYIRKAMEAG